MTAQIANGGHKIEPNIIYNEQTLQSTIGASSERFKQLYRNQENVKFVLDAQFGATNEPMGTSYRSRHVKPEYIFAGKTGTSQIRSITEEERKLKLKQKDLPYKRRDHALFTAFAPYKNPRYAFSILIEHGGTGSSAAAPIGKKLVKKVLDRHQLRKIYQLDLFQEV
jgi:penicillin-binding protein 2